MADLNGFTQIEVPETLAALQRLARAYRNQLRLKAIGVTGSSGKTSTKEMIASVLGERFSVIKTIGNYNNHIGLPLTVLGASSADDFGVFEMGMNHAGELAPLCEIARPDASVITNIGTAHIGHLETREAIAAEKAVVAEAVPAEGFRCSQCERRFHGLDRCALQSAGCSSRAQPGGCQGAEH